MLILNFYYLPDPACLNILFIWMNYLKIYIAGFVSFYNNFDDKNHWFQGFSIETTTN